MKAHRIYLPVLLCAVLSSGCMALLARSSYAPVVFPVYRGTILAPSILEQVPILWPPVLVDFPFTVALDTVLFPFEFAWWLLRPAEPDPEEDTPDTTETRRTGS